MCTHSKQVAAQFSVTRPVTKPQPAKTYQVFRDSPTEGWVVSILAGKKSYDSREAAQAELDRHLRICEQYGQKCQHTRKVFEVQDGKPIIEDKKYGVFFTLGGEPVRSLELRNRYETVEDARTAIDLFKNKCGIDYYVQEI